MYFLKSIVLLIVLTSLLSGLNGQEVEPIDETSVEVSEEDMSTEVVKDKVVETSTEGIAEVAAEVAAEVTSEATAEVTEVKTETLTTAVPEEVEPKIEILTPTSLQPTELKEYMTDHFFVADHKSPEGVDEFSCFRRPFGQYADPHYECHRFHFCYPFFNSSTDEVVYQRITLECDDNSVFDQKRFICVDNSTVEHKCSESVDLYQKTNEEFVIQLISHIVPQEVENDQLSAPQARPNSAPGWFSWLYRG